MKHKLLYSILTSKGHKNPLCFLVFTLLLLLQSFDASAVNPFVTRWNLATAGSGATQLSFGVQTSGVVNYTWTTVPAGTSGSGTFSGTTANITGLPAGATIDLSIEPANFQRFRTDVTIDRIRLIGIQQWGDVVWSSMGSAFGGCQNMVLDATDVPNTVNVTDMSYMFSDCSSFNQGLPNGFNTSNVTNMVAMFAGCIAYNQVLPSSFNTSNVTNMNRMFNGCTVYNQALPNGFNTSNVVDMGIMFSGCRAYNQVLPSSFNTSIVTDMSAMFNFCSAYNQALPSSFNTSNVTNMSSIFSSCSAYNQVLPSSFNTSNVANMSYMFYGCQSYNQALPSGFNTSNVSNMYGMFWGCVSFNQALPSSFNTGNVTDMSGMFVICVSYNQALPSSFNTSNVTSMSAMFYSCSAYNQALPSSFNTSNVTDMSNMFAGATMFDQNVGSFNIGNAVIMTDMFNNSGISISNYDAILMAWDAAGYTNKDLGNVSPLKYCSGEVARTSLISTKGWTITGDASAAPVAFTVIGGGAYCAGGSGVDIGLSNSEIDVTYQLVNGASIVGSPVSGTGAAISFGDQTAAGTYTVLATNTVTGCTTNMTGSATISVNALPTAFNLTGGNGVALGLSSSQTGVNYQLKRGGTTDVGSAIVGAGAALSFGVQITGGTYTVLATSNSGGCTASMSGSVIIANPFVTRWNLATAGSGATQLSFVVQLSGAVNYTWTTVPAGSSGSGTFYTPMANITGLPAGAIIDLSIAPANFQHIVINNGTDRNRLIGIEQWGEVVWTSMRAAFTGCQNMVVNATDVPNTVNVTDMSLMFYGCSSFNQPLPSGFNTAAVTDMSGMFSGCSSYNQALPSSFNTSNVTTMYTMFFGCSAFNQVLPSSFNTSNVTDMNRMLSGCSIYNQPLPSSFNTSSVTDMGSMFSGCSSFNQVLPGSFNTSNVVNMSGMFANCSVYNQALPSSFNTSSVTNMNGMFSGCSVYNQALPSSFITSNVTDMSALFYGCSSYNQAFPIGFNTSAVTNMGLMFYGCSAFNQALPNSFNTSNVTNMSSMFYGCSTYNQAFPSSFSTANVTVMNVMFAGATAFDQNIGNFVLANPSNMVNIFFNSGISQSNYDAILIAWNAAGYTNKNLGTAYPLRYCAGQAARTSLISTKGWTITGDASAAPVAFTMTGGGAYCAGGSGVAVGLSNSEVGVTYQLRNGGSDVGSPISGTGAAISFGNQTASGGYSVFATRTLGGCTSGMSGSVAVSISAFPTVFNLTGSNGVVLSLSGSQTGVNYQLKRGGTTNVGSAIAGTGAALSFGVQSTAGTYTVLATSSTGGCTTSMTGSVTITANPFVTRWNLATAGSGTTQLSIGVGTSGTVNYTWTTVPAGTSGSGTFSGTLATITGLPAGATIDLSIAPANFQRININNVTDRSRLIEVRQWGDVVWNSMQNAFYGCQNMVLNAADVPNTVNVTNMSGMFRECSVYNQALPIGFNTSAVTNMSLMFYLCNAYNQALPSSFNTSNVTNMFGMFSDCRAYNQPLPSSFNTSNVTDMSNMFYGCSAYNQPLPSSFNTSNVTNMGFMFANCRAYNQVLPNSFNTSSVTNMSNMFASCRAYNQPLPSSFNTSNVTNMQFMFGLCISYNQLLPNSFNTSNVTDMSNMFYACNAYNQPLPSSFNTSNVTNMQSMFQGCISFNRPLPSSFNTSNVLNMSNMFTGATAFDQNVGNFNIANASNMSNIFLNSGISIANYDAILIAWNAAGYTNKNIGSASPLRYCEGKAARTSLVTTKGWTITGDSYAGPSSYTLTGGGSYCAGGSGVAIGLSNSESGVTYQLRNGASNVGSPISGNGTARSFGNQTAAGTYTVVATRTATGCTTTMTGSQTVSINAAASNAALATNAVNGVPLTESCTENGWTYYVAPTNPSAYLFAVAWGSANNAARSSAVVSLHLNTALYGSTASSAVSGQGIPTGTWVMPRSWNVNTGGVALTAPVSVRFFYDQNEANNVQQAATNFASLHNLSAQSIEPFVWFKTVGVAYEPQNFNGTTLNANGVYRGQSIELQSTNGTENGVAYAEFSNIQSFSGGTGAAGVGNGNPLPIALEYFRGEKQGEKSLLTWRTQTELNNSHFVVERSNNGIDFVAIGRVDGSGNSTTPLNYSFTDEMPLPGNNYYRLRQLDFDGTEKRSGIVVLHFEKAFAVSTYPSPFEESFMIDVVTTGASEGLIEVFDMTGRLISSEKEDFTEGSNRKVVNAQVWTPGAYIVKVSTAGFTSYGTVVKSTF